MLIFKVGVLCVGGITKLNGAEKMYQLYFSLVKNIQYFLIHRDFSENEFCAFKFFFFYFYEIQRIFNLSLYV